MDLVSIDLWRRIPSAFAPNVNFSIVEDGHDLRQKIPPAHTILIVSKQTSFRMCPNPSINKYCYIIII